jgi:hypothetical protein
VEAALAEPRCFSLKNKIAPPQPTQKPPYFFRPARPQNGLGQVETPGKAKNKPQQNCLACINQANGAASRVSLLSAIGF